MRSIAVRHLVIGNNRGTWIVVRDIDAILIAGPTASGKSALALEIARVVNGVILNADSMQVYRDLSTLTARPQPEDMAGIPHQLYGFVGSSDAYSVGRYIADAAVHIETAHQRGQMPIIVGGTGLYFRGLLEGLSPVPAIDPEIRQRWRDVGDREGATRLVEALKARDPEMAARLMPTDAQRLVRALEVIESTGRSLSYWQKVPGKPVLDADRCIKLVVELDRVALYERCDLRFEQMLKQGAIFEVARLQATQIDPTLPIMRALGVAPIMAYLEGQADLQQATEQGQTETRQYAKRQLTWLRRNMMSWNKLNAQQTERNDALKLILGFLD